ncbi:VLRF1 family aeRF1-type release factor [Nonomuraea sp. NPDC048916]|uniref:VLRF1 family aeRF1-type release factor n=1 Tax=Nonomuraea sp. NPDC048916 TaxID=3154232 RepID=UPI0033E4E170
MIHDHAFLRELVAMKDEIGVVSLYVTADPRLEASVKPGWEILLRNELDTLREQVSGWPDRMRRATVLEHLDGLEPDIAQLVDPAVSGLGRALFAPVCTDDIHQTTLQVPVGTSAVLESTAYVRPMISAMATSAPAGIAVVSRDGVRLIDYRYGLAEDVYQSTFDLVIEDWRKMRGPSSPNTGQGSSTQYDKFQRRVDENLGRYLHSVTPEISNRVGSLRWTDVLLVGDARVTAILAEALHPLEVVQIDKIIDTLTPTEVIAHVSDALTQVRVRRDIALIQRTNDAALAGGRGVLGLGQTLALLNEGRVDCLLLDENGEWQGGRGPDGRLYPTGQVPPAVEAVDEPDLGERMIERALESGAEVTILHHEAATELADHDGVGALLRW